MNATISQPTIPQQSTVIMSEKEYDNMRIYCRRKGEQFKACYANGGIAFTASTMLLAFTGFLEF